MSRTPEYAVNKQPLWVQQIIARRDFEISELMLENERLLDVIAQLEGINNDNAMKAIDDANALEFALTRVDL